MNTRIENIKGRIAEQEAEKQEAINEYNEWADESKPVPSVIGTREQLLARYTSKIEQIEQSIEKSNKNLEQAKREAEAELKLKTKHTLIFDQIFSDLWIADLAPTRIGGCHIRVEVAKDTTADIRLDSYYSDTGRFSYSSGSEKFRVELSFNYKANEKDGRYTIKKDGTVNTKTIIERIKNAKTRMTSMVESEERAKRAKQTELTELNCMIPEGWKIEQKSDYVRGYGRNNAGGYTRNYLVVVPKDESNKGISVKVSRNSNGTWSFTKTVTASAVTADEMEKMLSTL